jgi:starch synthase
MHILLATSEMEPFARTGGLGDVLGSLPKALSELGMSVSVALPLYRMVDREKYGLKPFGNSRRISVNGKRKSYRLFKTTLGKIDVYFIDKSSYFDREGIYGTTESDYPDNAKRFIFFSRAVVDLAGQIQPGLHIIHVNDWQTGIIPVYLSAHPEIRAGFAKTATVFTIHNLGYQGIFPKADFRHTGLDWSFFKPETLEFYGKLNLLKGGIVFSDALNTVSQKYSEEILTPEFGFGLDGIIQQNREKFFGILNGVDYDRWNPLTDRFLPVNYSAESPAGKATCKKFVQGELKLPVKSGTPLFGMVTRLVEQKGIDLLIESLEELMAQDIQLVLLGLGPERYQEELESLSRRWPESFVFIEEYNDRLSHLIEAGSDFFLMPSHYEPCGLNQIYSLKYGTVPIVRATGGLEDTVVDVRKHPHQGNGFKFEEYSTGALLATVKEALTYYRTHKEDWKRIMDNAFMADFSWDVSARRYLDLYRWAFERKTGEKIPE